MIKGALAAVLAFALLCAGVFASLYLFAGWRVLVIDPEGATPKGITAIVGRNGQVIARLPYSAGLGHPTGHPS